MAKVDPVLEGARILVQLAKATAGKTGDEFAAAAREFTRDPTNFLTAGETFQVLEDLLDAESLERLVNTLVRDGGSIAFGVAAGLWIGTTSAAGVWNPALAYGVGEEAALSYKVMYDYLQELSRRRAWGPRF